MKARLAWWAARSHAADRLCRGSAIVWQQRTDALVAWVRAGRRDDLTGWKAALGPLLRLALLGALAYALWALVRALPWLMWLVSAWWLRAAWKATKTAPQAAAEEPEKPPAQASSQEVLDATLEWIRQQIGDRQGVHLRDLLAHAQAHGMFEGLEVSDLRGHLERWGIPVRDRQRVRGLGVTVGISKADLETPSGPSPEAAPEEAA